MYGISIRAWWWAGALVALADFCQIAPSELHVTRYVTLTGARIYLHKHELDSDAVVEANGCPCPSTLPK